MEFSQEQLLRWRLILGKSSQECMGKMSPAGCTLSAEQQEMDEALEAIYGGDSDDEISRDEWESPNDKLPPSLGGTAKGRQMPRVARWLDQIRNFFPKDVVVLLQHDAIERRGMKELLFEPEIMARVEPSIDLASAVLEMKNLVPEKAKAAAAGPCAARGRGASQAARIAVRPGDPRLARSEPALAIPQPAKPRLAANDPPQPQKLSRVSKDDHSGRDQFLQSPPAAKRV